MVRSALLFLVTFLLGTAVMVPLLDIASPQKLIPARDRPAAAAETSGEPARPAACRIKGNIAASGERLYHLPGGEFYNRTNIDAAAGERWFCTEAEALAAGWRPSRR